ncbi:MAG: tRNA (adenosine(37)-N6)-threonylcarbamoyltransferase complex dimerization subunit type 1 TsaB [Tepidisphaeraceae bacterium]
MPRALAIETSGQIGSIALCADGKAICEEQFPHGLAHAAQIVCIIDRLCRDTNRQPRDIDQIYVSTGPGSFTGLRIGVTVAKTLAFAHGAKLVGVPTVAVLVENAPPDARNVIVVLDAKRGQTFTARFVLAEKRWSQVEPAHLDDLASMLARSPRPVWLIGEGIDHHRNVIPPDDPGIVISPPESWRATAANVGRIGFAMALRGEFTEPDRLTPLYIRLPEAEEKLRGQSGQ